MPAPASTISHGREAGRTGEWRDGIGRLFATRRSRPQSRRSCSRPISMRSRRLNPAGALTRYPGSPALVARIAAAAGSADRLRARTARGGRARAQSLHGDRRAKAIAIDGWTALTAYVPPKERRGLVLIDPPFEQPDEFARLATGLDGAHRKWPTGIYLLWYPIKDRGEADALRPPRSRRSASPKSCGPN